MATTNVKVLIRKPSGNTVTKLPFPANLAANDIIRIPRRTPYADIINLTELRNDGFFRVPVGDFGVSSELGGSNVAGAETNLGLTLPRTEKLILLAKANNTDKVTLTISGNKRLGKGDTVISFTPAAAGEIFEIDLYDLGFFIEDTKMGHATIKTDKAISFLLVARY